MKLNGLRHCPRGCSSRVGYPLVGGTRQRHFIGTNFEPHKLSENAPTPTTIAPVLFRGSGARRRSRAAGLCWATTNLPERWLLKRRKALLTNSYR